ncbi:MAG: protein kinase, partial [Chloroflexota bacterium]
MSPEQAREQVLTGASDMYALGVVLHELLSGMLPFQKSSTLELLQAIVSEPPPPVPAHVPRAVAALSSAMLAKEPGARPSSMADLVRELCRLIESP